MTLNVGNTEAPLSELGTRARPDVLVVVRHLPSYPDVVDSLQRLSADGTVRSGHVLAMEPADARQRLEEYERQILKIVSERRTELVVFHHFHSTRLPDHRPLIEHIQALPHRPVVALTNGDAFYRGILRPSLPRTFVQASQVADAVFSTSMGVIADHLSSRGVQRLALLPNGVCQARFSPQLAHLSRQPEFRVVFIGSNNRPRNPLDRYHWFSRQRERLVRRLMKRFGSSFAVFGHGWEGIDGWQGPIPFELQHEACRRAEIVVGGVPYSGARYYTSDRVFIQIASGIPFVDIAVDGVEKLLRDGEHWHLTHSVDEMVDRCDAMLALPAADRLELGAEASRYVFRHHTVEARFRSLVATMTRLREAILSGTPPPRPDLSFLLPQVNEDAELPLATRRWS